MITEVSHDSTEERYCINCCTEIHADEIELHLAKDNCGSCGVGPVCPQCVLDSHMDGECADVDDADIGGESGT